MAPEAGDGSLSPLVSHPAFLTNGRAVSSSHLARPLFRVSVLWGRHSPSIRSGLRLLGVFGRVPTQELSPRRRRGEISLGPSLLYIACCSVCIAGFSFLGHLTYCEAIRLPNLYVNNHLQRELVSVLFEPEPDYGSMPLCTPGCPRAPCLRRGGADVTGPGSVDGSRLYGRALVSLHRVLP